MTRDEFNQALGGLGWIQAQAAAVLELSLRTVTRYATSPDPVPRVMALALDDARARKISPPAITGSDVKATKPTEAA
jgi:hypothetical protein